jgi:hypothetical protein
MDRRHLGTQPTQAPADPADRNSSRSRQSNWLFQQGADRWCIKSEAKEKRNGLAKHHLTLSLIGVHGFMGKDAPIEEINSYYLTSKSNQISIPNERAILDGKFKELLM